uniref:Uncharacterized protein n=1 Tax=Rhizophora mucronata TaxID=61149 RepID=A0A2P2Q243_RHIMU
MIYGECTRNSKSRHFRPYKVKFLC